jgi:hypothetical protein
MQPDPLHTREMVIIAILIGASIFAFGGAASYIGKSRANFDAPPVVARI